MSPHDTRRLSRRQAGAREPRSRARTAPRAPGTGELVDKGCDPVKAAVEGRAAEQRCLENAGLDPALADMPILERNPPPVDTPVLPMPVMPVPIIPLVVP